MPGLFRKNMAYFLASFSHRKRRHFHAAQRRKDIDSHEKLRFTFNINKFHVTFKHLM